jgi:L-seryl-tRNA(Ser) seleniumtransferase
VVEKLMHTKRPLLSELPSVDEILKSSFGQEWLNSSPRRVVLRAVRDILGKRRNEILEGMTPDVSPEALSQDISVMIQGLTSYKLRPLINATGVVIHTNLGRAVLSDRAIENIRRMAGSYSNLEYDLSLGRRGRRHSYLEDIIRELTCAEDAIVVNNNAAAVLLCLNTFAKDKEVVVSRGELVEIGGSFRIPEVMKSSGTLLREVGTTNKTHLHDYKNALSGNTALLLKVHTSNYRVIGFTHEVPMSEIARLGKEFHIPVMADLGSGCLIDLERFGITGEPTVQSVISSGVDIVTFSADKLLGGPQAGIVAGRRRLIGALQKNPMVRALRTDKVTMAALEATLMQYLDEDKAVHEIPSLTMLTQPVETIRRRARKIARLLKKTIASGADVTVRSDQSRAGGGSLPETDLPTFVVSVRPMKISVNRLEKRLRHADPPVIARISEDALVLDPRTVLDKEIKTLVNCVISAFNTK